MGPNERFDPAAPPEPPATEAVPPLHIVEATTSRVFPDVPVAQPADAVYGDPTVLAPVQAAPVRTVQAVHPVQAVAYAPAEPAYAEQVFIDEPRRPAWPFIVAALALLIGALAGYLIASAGDDKTTPVSTPAAGDVDATFNMLLTRTQTDGEYKSPSEYPQLDEITAIDNAAATKDLENQVAVLTAAQEQAAGLTKQVALLETALNDVTAERDTLAAQLGESGGTNTDTQAKLDAANQQIATLTSDLAAMRTELDSANAALKKAQTDLAAANATLDKLNVMPAPNYVNGDIARVRTEASANGWTLIEQPTDSQTAVGTVLEQFPAANSNMIKGSVLYVKVAKRP